MRSSPRLRIGGMTAILALGVAACSGGSPSPATSTAASAAPSTAASAAESMAPSTAESMAASAGPSQTAFDISSAAADISSLSSYQLDINLDSGGDVQTMSILTTKDPQASQYTITGSESMSLINIPDQGAWIEQGTTWIPAPGGISPYMALFDSLAPDKIITSFALVGYAADMQNMGSEDHNGVATTHYHADASTAGVTALGFPDNGMYDVWIADDGGYLVGMHYSGTNPDSGDLDQITIELTRVNDASIDIQPPI